MTKVIHRVGGAAMVAVLAIVIGAAALVGGDVRDAKAFSNGDRVAATGAYAYPNQPPLPNAGVDENGVPLCQWVYTTQAWASRHNPTPYWVLACKPPYGTLGVTVNPVLGYSNATPPATYNPQPNGSNRTGR